MVVEVIDAPWAGVPARFRWHKRRWICREHACQIATFIEQNHSVCTPRARLGGRSAGRSDSCASREPPLQDWLDNWQPRGIPCGPTSSRVCKPHLNTARFAGVQVLGVDEHVWHHQDRRRRGPRELTGIVDLTRGKDHPTARLLDLVPGRSGTVHENWLEERGEDFRAGVRIATLDPFQGQQERHRRSTPRRHQRARRLPHRQARWRRPR